MSGKIDLADEGLLDGLSGEQRQGREALLRELLEAGVDLEELREAVAQNRLAVMSAERVLAGRERYTPRQVAAEAGIEREQLDELWRALGMVVGDPDEAALTGEDLEAARRVRGFLDAGLEPAAIVEMSRVMAMAMSQVAAANRQMVGETFGPDRQSGERIETELQVARRFQSLTEALVPMVGPALEHIYKLQLREQLRHAAIDDGGPEDAGDGSGESMAIGFADLVGFTRLGEQLPPEEFGAITSRFGELSSEVASGPVRLVKLIGDAAMLASSDPCALADALLALVDLADAQGEDFPAVRAGLALGGVLPRGGDFYGRTVNLASRITGVARPDSLLVSEDARKRLEGEFEFSDAGSKRLKGIDGSVRIFRCRPLDDEPETESEPERRSGRDGEDQGEEPGARRRRRRR